MQAIILASGRGTRFHPLTDTIPKPLLPLANRPILEYLLPALTNAGCTEIFITIGYGGKQIQQFLGKIQVPCPVTPVQALEWEKGPLASFQAVIPHLTAQEPLILVPADLYISPQNLHLLTTTASEMALLFDSEKNQPGSLVQLDGSAHIRELTQSPTYLPGYHSSLPALRATTDFLKYGLTPSLEPQSTVFALLRHWLAQGRTIQGIPIVEKGWCDIDTPHQLVEMNRHLLTDGWPPHPLPPGTYLPAGTTMKGPLQNATLTLGHESLITGPALLGTGVQIGNNCVIHKGTSLGTSTIVQANSELAHCITLPHTQVPSNADLNAAVLDANGNILHSQ